MRSGSTTGACLEYLLKNEVLSELEKLADNDRPAGIKAEVLNAFNLLVALLDEKFLVHNAVSQRYAVEDERIRTSFACWAESGIHPRFIAL